MKIAIVTGSKHTKLFFLSCDYSGTLLYILSRTIIKGVRKKGETEVDEKTKATDVSQLFLLPVFSFFVSYGYEKKKTNRKQDSFKKGVAIRKDRRLNVKREKKEMEERIIRKKK